MHLTNDSSYIYTYLPSLRGPHSNRLILLTWVSNLLSQGNAAADSQVAILQEWANSNEGRSFYDKIAQVAQNPTSVENLSLAMLAMLSYARLIPDSHDHCEKPIHGSYLIDLDNHFRGRAPESRRTMMEDMVYAMIRVLSASADQYANLLVLLESVLDSPPPVLSYLAGLSDQYLNLRIKCHDHESAFKIVMAEAAVLLSKVRASLHQ